MFFDAETVLFIYVLIDIMPFTQQLKVTHNIPSF